MTKTHLGRKLFGIYKILRKVYGVQRCFLKHEDPLELLVSAVLSAQCTDAKVNSVTPGLFKRYPDVRSFASADIKELESAIKPCGLYHAKAKNIIGACKLLLSRFGGKVPDKMEDLTSLPGIGRKTANVVLGHAFGIPGFPVDTHVNRLLNRIGVAKTEDPVKIELIVNANLPAKYWSEFSLLLIQHGRNRCRSQRPDCPNCEIRGLCRKIIRRGECKTKFCRVRSGSASNAVTRHPRCRVSGVSILR